jgi:Fe-S-cluster containining protein
MPAPGSPAPPLPCHRCGACCRTFPIFASDADAAREPRIRDEGVELRPWLKTPRWTWRLFPLPFQERCCFLDAADRCAIYGTRPDVCREFEPGGGQCLEARRQAARDR